MNGSCKQWMAQVYLDAALDTIIIKSSSLTPSALSFSKFLTSFPLYSSCWFWSSTRVCSFTLRKQFRHSLYIHQSINPKYKVNSFPNRRTLWILKSAFQFQFFTCSSRSPSKQRFKLYFNSIVKHRKIPINRIWITTINDKLVKKFSPPLPAELSHFQPIQNKNPEN